MVNGFDIASANAKERVTAVSGHTLFDQMLGKSVDFRRPSEYGMDGETIRTGHISYVSKL